MSKLHTTVENDRPWILAAIDFSPHSRNALCRAAALASERGAELLVLHVIYAPDLEGISRLAEFPERALRERLAEERKQQLEEILEKTLNENVAPKQPSVDLVVSWGHPFAQILQKAAEFEVDLIVLGIAGHSADLERTLFGSTAEKVLRGTRCDVLCVPL